MSDRVPDVQPVGLALRKSHSTVQPTTPGDIPETVPIDPALDGSPSTGQSSKPGNHQQYRSSVNQIDNANAQTQAAGNWMSRPPPGSTTPTQVPPRKRGRPRGSRAPRRRDVREGNRVQEHQPSAYQADTINTQIQGPESWMSRPSPRSTTPIQAPPRSRGKPRILVHQDGKMPGKETGGKGDKPNSKDHWLPLGPPQPVPSCHLMLHDVRKGGRNKHSN
ncbi:hypothetical protein BGZ61DRAFT_487534 [Ilyonectria robusta]|uniref:uncharacterized protein n=1 Tax=Ilyonectria robusta TaxID=1079257 RepID=UPI001E8EBFD4|nr:uncharacterized protein BGZ61DRAFT_487534 [Ilyonectria robusta]KAH8651978.1 hypothetical protein BGZ61DRAFT_487534 [Ilyonectria robusta]